MASQNELSEIPRDYILGHYIATWVKFHHFSLKRVGSKALAKHSPKWFASLVTPENRTWEIFYFRSSTSLMNIIVRHCNFEHQITTSDALHMIEFPVMKLQTQKQRFVTRVQYDSCWICLDLWKYKLRIGQGSPEINQSLYTYWVNCLTGVCGCTLWNK